MVNCYRNISKGPKKVCFLYSILDSFFFLSNNACFMAAVVEMQCCNYVFMLIRSLGVVRAETS